MDETASTTATDEDTATASTDDGLPAEAVAAALTCDRAPWLAGGAGLIAFGSTESDALAEHCNLTGLWRFFRVAMPIAGDLRLTLDPPHPGLKVAVFERDCAEPTPQCGGPLGLWLADLPAGAEAWIGIGADSAAFPELAQPPWPHFTLHASTRPLLPNGTPCTNDGQGPRCQSGLRCLASASPETAPTCQIIAGDRCSSAVDLRIPAPDDGDLATWRFVVDVDPSLGWGDDHEHSCAGAQWGDYTGRLRFDGAWSAQLAKGSRVTSHLQVAIEASDDLANSRVSLAIRDPGCTPERELACQRGQAMAPALLRWPVLTGEDLQTPGALERQPLLFVDWAPERLQPIRLVFSVVDDPAD